MKKLLKIVILNLIQDPYKNLYRFRVKHGMTVLFYILILSIFPTYTQAASLTLSPATGAFNKGCQVNVEIKLDTGGQQTDGTDAIVLFDAAKLTANPVTPGTIFPDYPGNNVDNETGKIMVSGLPSVSSAFSGQGTLATLNFTVKDTAAVGATIIKFDYDPSGKSASAQCMSSGTNTCDSNVVPKGGNLDILSSVGNGTYTIGTGACATLGGGGQGAVGIGGTAPSQTQIKEIPVKEVPIKTLPPAGSEQFTFMVAILGSALTVLGILGLVLL